MPVSEDPQWVEQARQDGLHLQKRKDGLYVIVKTRISSPHESPLEAREPARDAQAGEQRSVGEPAANA